VERARATARADVVGAFLLIAWAEGLGFWFWWFGSLWCTARLDRLRLPREVAVDCGEVIGGEHESRAIPRGLCLVIPSTRRRVEVSCRYRNRCRRVAPIREPYRHGLREGRTARFELEPVKRGRGVGKLCGQLIAEDNRRDANRNRRRERARRDDDLNSILRIR